uniref:BRO1 domain-containing protein n=1 Tax=Araucaria cunninghamii TaxID=56994 RepID=A0A0D6R8E4_ARACU
MGCIVSTSQDGSPARRKKTGNVSEVVAFVPGLRIPKSIDLGESLHGYSSASIVERLSALRTRISIMTAEELPTTAKTKRKTSTQQGGSTLGDLQQALEDYLPVLLGLAKKGSQQTDLVEFSWINQEDDEKETSLSNTWYEVLSILHMMAMTCLLQANSLLIPKAPADGYPPKVSEENKKASIDMFLKAGGYLDYGARHILIQIPNEVKSKLPTDLHEGVLQAISAQALGQCVEIQLGMAIDSPKATLAVKRRLACEQVEYWRQAQHCISDVRLENDWGQKHVLFIQWKFAEAKAAAYYYHGLILDEGNEESAHTKAVACLRAAEQFLKESKSACINFCLATPVTRVPPVWGAMKYLYEMIPKDASSKAQAKGDAYNFQKLLEGLPKLPNFPVALKPDEYEMPPIDSSWN